MKTLYKLFLILIFTLPFVVAVYKAQADTVTYPVAELGNCADEDACKSYCNESSHYSACLNFAESRDLMAPEELESAKKFVESGAGPGGCTTPDTCETYCNDLTHINECVAFAEENNLMTPQELAEAKKVQAAMANGINPPCANKAACDTYCDDSSHMQECISFAEQAGILQGEELENAQKMLAAVQRGVTPPPCRGKDACDEYCSQPQNMETCMNFAIEAGFMSEQEKADAQKALQAIKNGVNPPNCRGNECDTYCAQEEHFEECLNFALAAGMMTEEDAVMARKTGGKGPGGCKGQEACQSFCDNPDNQETCFNFAKEYGLISEEELQQMEQGKADMQNALATSPPETIECLTTLLGPELMEKLKAGTAMPSKDIGDKMEECFSKSFNGGVPTGPGGCQGEECTVYCQEHPEECQGMSIPGSPDYQPSMPQGCIDRGLNGQDCQALCQTDPLACTPAGLEPNPDYGPKETGPGGCQSNEECDAYCQTHPQECGVPAPSEPEPGYDNWTEPGPGGCRNEAECGFAPGPPPSQEQPSPAPEPVPEPPQENPPSSLLDLNSLTASVFQILSGFLPK